MENQVVGVHYNVSKRMILVKSVNDLPEPTLEFCGEFGVSYQVGHTHDKGIVYRATFDSKKKEGSWAFLYHVDSPWSNITEFK